jgi:ketosteroid isomerase-like protein
MSRENVEVVVGTQFEDFNARNFAAILDAWTEDVSLVAHGSWALVGPGGHGVVGKEAVAATFGDWFAEFGRDYQVEIDELHDLGDRVLVVATDRSRGRTSGVPVSVQASYLYTLRERRICRIEIWDDRNAALEAAGLQE